MATPIDKYYTYLYSTITECNDRNCATLSNDNIRDEIHRVIVEEEVDAHNITMDTFIQMPVTSNTQGENENKILTSQKRNKLDALAETLKTLKINDAEYYKSDSENTNYVKGDPASNPKVSTHTSKGGIKVTDTSN